MVEWATRWERSLSWRGLKSEIWYLLFCKTFELKDWVAHDKTEPTITQKTNLPFPEIFAWKIGIAS